MEKPVHLIYVSRAAVPFSKDDIAKLLKKARATNAPLGVTGMLLHVDSSFFQVLEGDELEVQGLYNRIAGDRRHGTVLKLVSEPIEKRDFAQWTMGHALATRADIAALDGMNDFFVKGSCLSDLTLGAAQKLLRAFREGSFRAPIR
ncbi:MAG: BLUF domain-containing protein [Polyangiaceae bacterium]